MAGVGAGGDEEVVFELLGVAVEDEIDAGVGLGDLDAAEVRDLGDPL